MSFGLFNCCKTIKRPVRTFRKAHLPTNIFNFGSGIRGPRGTASSIWTELNLIEWHALHYDWIRDTKFPGELDAKGYIQYRLTHRRLWYITTAGGWVFYLYGWNLIFAWISNHMSNKVWKKVFILSQTWLVANNFNPPFIMDEITHPCRA